MAVDVRCPVVQVSVAHDFSHFLSNSARRRTPTAIKQLYKYYRIPGIAQLAGGLPNKNYFPFDELKAGTALPERWVTLPHADNNLLSRTLDRTAQDSHTSQVIKIPHTSTYVNPLEKIDLATALQYGTAQGYAPLYAFLRSFARDVLHPNCPYERGPEILLTCGNTDAFFKVLQCLTNEWSETEPIEHRQGLLVEKFCYMSSVQVAQHRNLNIVPVELDAEGLKASGPGGLRDVLLQWDASKGKRPHLLYLVPTGQNPTSAVLSFQRRNEIYRVCSEFDIIIVEDDPYFNLQYTSLKAETIPVSKERKEQVEQSDGIAYFNTGELHPSGWRSTGYGFLDALVPSFVQIDTEGRVIRLDSFSKSFSPGCRLGWITAQPALIDHLFMITETSTQSPSGFGQSVISELLIGQHSKGVEFDDTGATNAGKSPNKGWGVHGLVKWLEGLQVVYHKRMMKMCCALRDQRQTTTSQGLELSTIYSFTWPAGGMFVWLRVQFEAHPLYRHYASIGEVAKLSRALWLLWTTAPYLVLIAPGSTFSPTGDISDQFGWQTFRICFASINEADIVDRSRKIAMGIAAFFEVNDGKIIDDLLNTDKVADQVDEDDTVVIGECHVDVDSL